MKTRQSNVEQALPRLLSINDTAAVLGIGRTKVYDLINTGEIRPVRVGSRFRLRLSDLEAYLERWSP